MLLLTVLLPAAGACSHRRSDPEMFEPRPQRLDADLAYTFELRTDPFTMIRVSLSVMGAESGATEFALAKEWASVRETAGAIRGVRAADRKGRKLEIESPDPHHWIVHHPAGEQITISYYLVGAAGPIGDQSEQYYSVITRPDLFHMIGRVGLIQPEGIDGDMPLDVRVRWRGFQERGWNVACSFSADQDGFRMRLTPDELSQAVYLAGDLRLPAKRVRGRNVQFAIYGDWHFDDEQFVDLATSIVETEREFFDDFDLPYFLITLIPVGDEHSGTMGGTGLTDSFALFLGPRFTLQSDDGLRIRKLLAHELFHYWNGSRMPREDPEQLVYWFSEGFTDFYARRLLRRARLISDEQFIAMVNRRFARFMLNPVRTAPNQRVLESFWNEPPVRDLPYQRGDITALLLDREIRRVTGGKQSLDDLMRDLLRRGDAGERLSTDMLLTSFESATSPEFAKLLRAFIVDGVTPQIPADLLDPIATMKTEPLGRYDLGFDFQATQRDRIFRGVAPDSRAYQAGLRDGQAVGGWSIHFGEATTPVTIQIRTDDGVSTISYLPQSRATIPVPVFRLAAPDEKVLPD